MYIDCTCFIRFGRHTARCKRGSITCSPILYTLFETESTVSPQKWQDRRSQQNLNQHHIGNSLQLAIGCLVRNHILPVNRQSKSFGIQIRKTKDMTNSKMLANLVSIFYQIHSKMLKHISNKKARTLFTEFYVKHY